MRWLHCVWTFLDHICLNQRGRPKAGARGWLNAMRAGAAGPRASSPAKAKALGCRYVALTAWKSWILCWLEAREAECSAKAAEEAKETGQEKAAEAKKKAAAQQKREEAEAKQKAKAQKQTVQHMGVADRVFQPFCPAATRSSILALNQSCHFMSPDKMKAPLPHLWLGCFNLPS